MSPILTSTGPKPYSASIDRRERSSAVEHTVHIGVVTGSIPVAPTIALSQNDVVDLHEFGDFRNPAIFHKGNMSRMVIVA